MSDNAIQECFLLVAHNDFPGAQRQALKLHHGPGHGSQVNYTHTCIDSLSHTLVHLFQLEALYVKLALSRPKRVFARELLDQAYLGLVDELRATANPSVHSPPLLKHSPLISHGKSASNVSMNSTSALLAMVDPLIHLCHTRVTMIQLWRRLTKCIDAEDLLSILPIAENVFINIDFTLLTRLSPLYSALIQREIRCFLALLHTEKGIYFHNLVEALSSLSTAHAILSDWKSAAFPDRSLISLNATSKMAKSLLIGSGMASPPSYFLFWSDLVRHYFSKLNLHFPHLSFPNQKVATELTDMIDDALKAQQKNLEVSFHLLYHAFAVSSAPFPTPSASSLPSSGPSSIPTNPASPLGNVNHPPILQRQFHHSGYSFPLSPASTRTTSSSHFASSPDSNTPDSNTAMSFSSNISSLHFPSLYSVPSDLSPGDRATLHSLLMPAPIALEIGELLPFVDNKSTRSYYIARLGEYLYAVVILGDRKPHDLTTIEFLTSFQSSMFARDILARILI